MKVLVGFVCGLLFLLVLGAAAKHEITEHLVTVKGDIVSPTIKYQSTFSSISPDGNCYLAITDTLSGRTVIFKITKNVGVAFTGQAFQKGEEGRVIAIP
jgi:hypothetical protein